MQQTYLTSSTSLHITGLKHFFLTAFKFGTLIINILGHGMSERPFLRLSLSPDIKCLK